MFADRSLVWLSPERLCQILTNTDVDVCSIGWSKWSPMEDLEKGLKELKGFVTPIGRTTILNNQIP